MAGLSGKMFQDAGVFHQSLEMQGSIKLGPAKKLAAVSLAVLQKNGFAFLLPHLLYEAGVTWDPSMEYATAERAEVPCMYWDAPYALITGLRSPITASKANRLYAVQHSDLRGILNCANASLYLNTEQNVACRLNYVRLSLLDFNAPAVGTLTPADMQIWVYAWVIEYATTSMELQVAEQVKSIPKSYAIKHVARTAQELASAVDIVTRNENDKLQKAVEVTEFETEDVAIHATGVVDGDQGQHDDARRSR